MARDVFNTFDFEAHKNLCHTQLEILSVLFYGPHVYDNDPFGSVAKVNFSNIGHTKLASFIDCSGSKL